MKIPNKPSGPTPTAPGPGGEGAREVTGPAGKTPAAPTPIVGSPAEKIRGVTSFTPGGSEPVSRLSAALLERFRSPSLRLAPPKPPVTERAAPARTADTQAPPPRPGETGDPVALAAAEQKPTGDAPPVEGAAKAGAGETEITRTEAKQVAEQKATERAKQAVLSEKPQPWRRVADALAWTMEALGARTAGRIAQQLIQTLSTQHRMAIVDTINHLKAGDPTKALNAWRQIGPQVFTVKIGGMIQHVLRYSYVDGNGSMMGMVQQVRQSIDPSADAAKGKGGAAGSVDDAIAGQRETLQAMADAAERLHEAAMEVIRADG